MFLVTVLEKNRVLRKEIFRNEDCAFAYFDVWYSKGYKVEFSKLGVQR